MTTISLPSPIAHYLAADSAQDLTAFLACFTPDAYVHDESHDYRGHEQIRAWKESTMKKYTYTVEPLKLTENGPVATLEAKVVGSFPGSPVTLRFAFTLDGDRIRELQIH